MIVRTIDGQDFTFPDESKLATYYKGLLVIPPTGDEVFFYYEDMDDFYNNGVWMKSLRPIPEAS